MLERVAQYSKSFAEGSISSAKFTIISRFWSVSYTFREFIYIIYEDYGGSRPS
jgi:hypothetical protein